MLICFFFFLFFFQAEDGIRDRDVTGVQTCALPISFSALLLGMAFAFGWTPCIGPVLGGVLTISATQNDVGTGIRLLAAYSLGLGLPFILTALFLRRAVTHLKRLRTVGLYLQWGAGNVMIAVGIAMITGQLTALSYWLLRVFPALGNIG